MKIENENPRWVDKILKLNEEEPKEALPNSNEETNNN